MEKQFEKDNGFIEEQWVTPGGEGVSYQERGG